MRELRMLPDAVDRQLSAFDVDEEEPRTSSETGV